MEDSVIEYYDNLSNDYDELYGEEQKRKIEFIKNLYKRLFNGKIFENGLDFGCGTGISTLFLKEISKKVYIYDISEKMIEKAKQRIPEAIVIKDLNKYEKFFDIIISITVLQDSKNPEKILEIFNKLLKDDGIIILSVLKKSGIQYWKNIIKSIFSIMWFEEEEKDFIFILMKK